MGKSIDKKISLLPPEKQKKFEEELMDILYDTWWFRDHGMDYVDPDIQKVKEILFREEYKQHMTS